MRCFPKVLALGLVFMMGIAVPIAMAVENASAPNATTQQTTDKTDKDKKIRKKVKPSKKPKKSKKLGEAQTSTPPSAPKTT